MVVVFPRVVVRVVCRALGWEEVGAPMLAVWERRCAG